MLNIFIPSYNRPLQLLALLESFKKYNHCLSCKIHVRYEGSTDLTRQAYKKLLDHPIVEDIDFQPKKGLSLDMLEIMRNTSDKYFAIISDDSIFYRPFCLKEDDFDDFMTDEVNHFTWRLGFNTTQVDYINPNEHHDLIGDKIGPFIKFNWVNHSGHHGHPVGLDGYLFNREWILNQTLKNVGESFDYRRWECIVGAYIKNTRERPYSLCLPNSVLVNSPNNIVVDCNTTRNGVIHPYSTDELARKFLDGYKIDIKSINKNNINSVQIELPFQFIKENV